MNGRRRGTREESRKQALDSSCSMEMSKLTRDGTTERVSRNQILRRERTRTANNSFSLFSCGPRAGLATLTGCEGHTYIILHTHTAVYTVNRARMLMSPNKKCSGTWYINQYKQQYCVCFVCFLPIHSGHQWTYQPGSHRRKVTQDF